MSYLLIFNLSSQEMKVAFRQYEMLYVRRYLCNVKTFTGVSTILDSLLTSSLMEMPHEGKI